MLKKWGGEYTAEKMQEVLENEVEHYMFLRQYAIELLGEVYHHRSIEVLENALNKPLMLEEKRAIYKSINKLRREEKRNSQSI